MRTELINNDKATIIDLKKVGVNWAAIQYNTIQYKGYHTV
jgi:hypothetical protein